MGHLSHLGSDFASYWEDSDFRPHRTLLVSRCTNLCRGYPWTFVIAETIHVGRLCDSELNRGQASCRARGAYLAIDPHRQCLHMEDVLLCSR